jgi:hypothetical protein
MPASRVTMQHLIPYTGLVPVPQLDIQPDWSGPVAPPSILLDYVYGVAVFKLWAVDDIQETLRERHEADFAAITLPEATPPSSSSEDETYNDSDHIADPDYVPRGAGHGRRVHHVSRESEMSRAMDDAFRFSMFIRGYPPETFAAMQKRREEEAEVQSRQVGQEKVKMWLEAGEHYYCLTRSDNGGLLIGQCRCIRP